MTLGNQIGLYSGLGLCLLPAVWLGVHAIKSRKRAKDRPR